MNERRRLFDRRAARSIRSQSTIPRVWKALLGLCFVLIALLFLVVALLFARAGGDALRACQRANDVRVALNERTPLHEADARNLARLTKALAENRDKEAEAILAIARRFRVDLSGFENVLKDAAEQDARIFADASKVKFDHVDIPDCETIVKSG